MTRKESPAGNNVYSLCKKIPYFKKQVSEIAKIDADEVLKFKEFTFINYFFQHKSNDDIGVFWRTLVTDVSMSFGRWKVGNKTFHRPKDMETLIRSAEKL